METFSRGFQKVCTALALLAAASVALMIISTTLDTTFRYGLNFPIPGVFELNEVLLVTTVFLGITWTQGEKGHTRVVLWMRRLPIRRAIKVDIVCWLLCIFFLGIMGFQSGREALRSYSIGEFRWGAVQMPIWWAKALVPLGCWLTCVQLMIDIWTDLRRLRGDLPLDLPDLRQVGD